MAHTKNALKRVRQSAKNLARNRAGKALIATAKKRFTAAVEAGDKTKALENFNAYSSSLDKTAKRGIITKNTASRKKARASAKLVGLKG